MDCEVYGQRVNLVAVNKKDPLILIGNGNPKSFIEEYKKRWHIEELFGCLKSRGFNLEQTHLTDPKKLSTLLALLTLAFLWSVKTGQWLEQIDPTPKKKL